MLYINFELIHIEFGFFMNFKVAQKLGQKSCTIVQGILSKMAPKKLTIFIIFSDMYTCSYVVHKF